MTHITPSVHLRLRRGILTQGLVPYLASKELFFFVYHKADPLCRPSIHPATFNVGDGMSIEFPYACAFGREMIHAIEVRRGKKHKRLCAFIPDRQLTLEVGETLTLELRWA